MLKTPFCWLIFHIKKMLTDRIFIGKLLATSNNSWKSKEGQTSYEKICPDCHFCSRKDWEWYYSLEDCVKANFVMFIEKPNLMQSQTVDE